MSDNSAFLKLTTYWAEVLRETEGQPKAPGHEIAADHAAFHGIGSGLLDLPQGTVVARPADRAPVRILQCQECGAKDQRVGEKCEYCRHTLPRP